MARKHQDQGEYTIQSDVGPGDQTGIYYITFCNLPFDTSWQQLKDWLRPVCKVDHVEVFEKSTSGWVRVQGKENFENAWKLLDGGVFHGRSIIASDKNRTDTIKIKSMLEFSTGPARDRQRAGAGPLTQPASPTGPYSPTSFAPTPHHGDGSYAHHSAAMYAPDHGSFVAPPMVQYPVTMPGPVPMAHAITQYDYYSGSSQNDHLYQGQVQASHGVVSSPKLVCDITARPPKVCVKNFAHRTAANDIDSWIRRRLELENLGVEGIDISVNEKGRNAGHVYVRLSYETDPTHAVRLLHHVHFRGRTLSAWLVYAEDVDGQPVRPKHPQAARDKHRGGKASSGTVPEHHKRRHHRATSERSCTNDIVVAEGSSQKGSGKAH